MRRPAFIPLLFTLLILVATVPAAQVDYTVSDSIRLPAESYVGDTVELRFTIRTQAQPVVPDELPQPRWGTLSAARVIPVSGGFDLRLSATPFEPGTLTLPPLDLGGLVVADLSLDVESILPAGETGLRPVQSPQRLPGTQATLLLLAFGISFVAALTIYLAGPGRRHITALVLRRRARVPYRKLLSCVHALETNIKRYSMRDFYIELMRELQAFIGSRVESNCLAATSTELLAVLPDLESGCGVKEGTTGPLVEVIQSADSVKFARKTVRRKKRLRHLMLVRAVAVELETHRRKLRKAKHDDVTEEAHAGA